MASTANGSGGGESDNMTPHEGQPVQTQGAPLEQARAAVILLHGRGGTAADMLAFSRELVAPEVAYLAPQAAENTWYPYSFLSPLEFNEPELSSALKVIETLFQRIAAARISAERVLLLGFSQGACLALEYAARHAQRYGGIAGFSGGLIGPDSAPRNYTGSLEGTPVFLGCSDNDPHIPRARVEESATILTRLGGEVTLQLYEGMGHTINRDEIRHARALINRLSGREGQHD
jgi:predicted esterase